MNVGRNTCQLSMGELGVESKWGLRDGDRIEFRVRAWNENGEGAWSADQTQIVRMITVPQQMDPPTTQISL